jgi:hypothetical protein
MNILLKNFAPHGTFFFVENQRSNKILIFQNKPPNLVEIKEKAPFGDV